MSSTLPKLEYNGVVPNKSELPATLEVDLRDFLRELSNHIQEP